MTRKNGYYEPLNEFTSLLQPTMYAEDGSKDYNQSSNQQRNDDLRLCRLPQTPRLNETNVILRPDFNFPYQCAGSKYDACVATIEQFAREHRKTSVNGTWGSVGTPFLGGADHAGAAVLFMGNSNTRQIVEALVCQYNQDVVQADSTKVLLKNNITIYRSINLFYHHLPSQWQTYVEQHVLDGRPLSSLDAIVLGDSNIPENCRHTNFYQTVMEQAVKEGVRLDESFTPTIDVVARAFPRGPIVYVSNVRNTAILPKTAQRLQAVRREQPNRTNIVAIAGGQYVSSIGHCLARDKHNVGPAFANGDGHRCMGRGGHPDLLAWDVEEILSQQLPLPALKESHIKHAILPATALDRFLQQAKNIEKVEIGSIDLQGTPEELQSIGATLGTHSSLKSLLDFSLGSERGNSGIVGALAKVEALENVKLDAAHKRLRNIVGSEAAAIKPESTVRGFALANLVAQTTNLSELHISRLTLDLHDFHAVSAAVAKAPSLHTLGLTNVGLTDDACNKLGNAIAENTNLVTIDLSCNKLTDVRCTLLATALINISHVKLLRLWGNMNITNMGFAALVDMLEHNSVLERLPLMALKILRE